MGEGGEKKKPSSLRARVDRSRKAYGRKSNPMPLVIGAVVLGVMLVGLYLFVGTKPKKFQRDETTPPAAGTSTDASTSAAPGGPTHAEPRNLFELLYYARDDSTRDPDKALRDLQAAESKYGNVPDFHVGMAMAIDKKIGRAQGNAEKKRLAEQKLQRLEKAKELVDAGTPWDDDPKGTRTENLDTSIAQCKLLIDKFGE